jgi:GT2 family glycosyltransferase
MTAALGVSIIVCTRNRASQLPGSLEAIRHAIAAADDLAVQIVIVDNGSTDATAKVIDDWLPRMGAHGLRIFAAKPGLAAARNAGIAASRYPIIAMTDDDCHPEADWLITLANRFASDSVPVIRGGRVELGDPSDLRITVRTGDMPEVYDLSRSCSGFVIGANLAFPRSVFDTLGGFDERFGAGARYKAAEETDFVFRAALLGIPVLYDPAIAVRHFHGRRSNADLVALVSGYCFSEGALFAKHFRTSHFARAMYFGWLKTMIKERLGLYKPDWITPGYPGFGRMFLDVNRGMLAYCRNG